MEPFVKKEKVNEPVLFWLHDWMESFQGLSAGFTSRQGGMSEGQWSSLNCAFHVNDKAEHVIENRRKVIQAAGFPFEAWTCAEQVHGKDVYKVTSEDKGRGSLSRESAVQDKDALITGEAGIFLASFYADCVPLFFMDPVRKAVGLAHAGWKGTVSSIAQSTIQAMVDDLGCSIENIRSAIGPSIGPCCYEVDHNVIGYFHNANIHYGIEQKDNGHYWLDLKEINRQIMIKAGIMPMHIEISSLCTSCRPDYFFSHRLEKGKTGRMMSWIGMKEKG
jgi:YfiH family protein